MHILCRIYDVIYHIISYIVPYIVSYTLYAYSMHLIFIYIYIHIMYVAQLYDILFITMYFVDINIPSVHSLLFSIPSSSWFGVTPDAGRGKYVGFHQQDEDLV